MTSGTKIGNITARNNLPRLYYELAVISFVLMLGMSFPASFLPILAANLDPSGVLVGMVVSAWFLSRMFLELPAGIISDRIGRRKLLLFGLALSCIGPILCGFADNGWILVLGRCIWGMGTAIYFMNNTALLMDILPLKIRGSALGFSHGIEFVGSFIGVPIGAFLTIYMSFQHIFYVALSITVISLCTAWWSESMREVDEKEESRNRLPLGTLIRALGDRGILIVCISTLLRMLFMQGVFQTVFQLFLHNGLFLTVSAIGLVLGARIVGQIISVVLAGILSDRIGRKPVLIAGYTICSFTLFAFTLTSDYELLLLIGLIEGIGEGFGMITLIALLTDITPPAMRGGAIGLYRTFQDFGGFAGPLLFMVIYGGWGAFTAFHAAVVLNIINILLISINFKRSRVLS